MNPDNATILSDMLQPLGTLTPEAAQEFVGLKVPNSVQERVAVLAQKNNDGTINEKEIAEYQTYVTYGNMLSVMKAKAKKVVAENV